MRFCIQPIPNTALKKIFLFFILTSILASTACNTTRRAHKGDLKPRSEKYLMKRLLANQVNAEWLGTKAKISYQDEYVRESFTAYVRMKKDSAIWMSIKKFGFEGARAFITPDSIFVLDRLNNEYIAQPFEYAQKEFRLPVGFQGLQAMLLGNPVFFSNKTETGVDGSRYKFSQKTENLHAEYWLDVVKILLSEFKIEDFRNKRELTYTASDYQLLPDKQNFSYFRRFNLKSSDLGSMQVSIDFSKVEIDVPQNMSFSIPKRYEMVR